VLNRDSVDAGVYEGGEVSVFYDPLISKLVTWGPTRDECIKTMSHALDTYQIEVCTYHRTHARTRYRRLTRRVCV
jgi:acetyl/propionyl-CoA carboxylase alpha subunit